MARTHRVALVGDYSPSVLAHQAIPPALELAAAQTGKDVEGVWVHTSSISDSEAQFEEFDGIWCVPATPYANTAGALRAIEYARLQKRPFLGTCGGFQYAVIEYARNVCGLRDAEHGETNPEAALCVITALSCSLIEQSGEIVLADGTLIRRAYGQERIVEGYHCSYGINRQFESLLLSRDLRATAHDWAGEVRAVELLGHPFFVGTLFQPERRALRGESPPLVAAFVNSMGAGAA
jgi:CTP synthase (UTP-ammonia lyase)